MATQVIAGRGELRFFGFAGDVGYELHGPLTQRRGVRPACGWIDASASDARAAFHAGHATLTLDAEREVVVTVTAHSEGSGRAYVEVEP
jgi:hypothetical protein